MFPYPYRKPQLDLFYKLVEDANPGITQDLPANSKLGTPVAQSVPSTGFPANTNILITGKSLYYRNKRVTYRRIDLANLFKNVTITFDKWVSTATLAKSDFIELMNSVYGMSLVDADISVTSFTSGALTAVTMTSSSLCYIGTINVRWTKGLRNINDLLPSGSSLTGRLYPGGNTFGGGRKPQGEYLCYDTDFASLSGTINGLTTGTLDYTNATHKSIIDYLTANVSTDFNGTAHTNNGGLNGLTFAKYTMPTANAPEANSASSVFNTVFVITAQATSWFQGKILMHCKV